MPLKDNPCAYCGGVDTKREKGHVVPRCLYGKAGANTVNRITVPECVNCKAIWQDDEAHFRTVLGIIEKSNERARQLKGPIKRSLDKPDGKRRAKDVVEQMKHVVLNGEPRQKIYPGKDKRVMAVIRKIVRGLCHHHGLWTAVPDKLVLADVLKNPVPQDSVNQMKYHHQEADVFSYWYYTYPDGNLHSYWLMLFFEGIPFIAKVAKSEKTWDDPRTQSLNTP